ncbi:MAG: hypothetical protein U1E76_23240 [Planctomycetota bacterium]
MKYQTARGSSARGSSTTLCCALLIAALVSCQVTRPPDKGQSFVTIKDSLDNAETHYVERPEGPTTGEKILWYLPNRFLDLLDVFNAQIGIGPGAGAELQVTRAARAGALYYDAVKFGFDGREVGIFRERRWNEWYLGELHDQSRDSARLTMAGSISPWEDPNPEGVPSVVRKQRGLLDIDLNLHLLAGAEAGIRPVEIFDFLAGWVTFDPSNDDFGNDVVEVREYNPPMKTVTRFFQAIDNLDFNQLRTTLSDELWVNSWVKKADGTVLAGRRFEEEKLVGRPAVGKLEDAVVAPGEIDVVCIDTVTISPERYRHPVNKTFNAKYDLKSVELRRGVPKTFEGRVIVQNESLRRQETFFISMKVQRGAWVIDKFRKEKEEVY